MRVTVECPDCGVFYRLHHMSITIATTLDSVTFECLIDQQTVTIPATSGELARLAAAGSPINLPADPKVTAR